MAKSGLCPAGPVSTIRAISPSIVDLCVLPSSLYHAARLRWNSIERKRGPFEDLLIDDVAEWSLWHYATGMLELPSHALITDGPC